MDEYSWTRITVGYPVATPPLPEIDGYWPYNLDMDNADTLELEMDNPTGLRAGGALGAPDVLELDLTDSKSQHCLICGGRRAVNERSVCQLCSDTTARANAEAVAQDEPAAPDIASDLADIGHQAAANAAVQGIGSQRGPAATMRGVGFANRDGYIQAIRNGVPEHTHASYLTTLRAQYGMTSADLAALSLPGPMAESALPVGDGVAHVPAGHTSGAAGIFDRQGAARQFRVGDAATEYQTIKPADLKAERLVAVARSEGHGVVVAWNGRRQIKRADLAAALEAIGATELMPRANSARAQAGRAVTTLNNAGYVVRAERRPVINAGETAPDYDARWTVGRVSHDVVTVEVAGGQAPQALGKRIMQLTLRDDVLTVTGDESLGRQVLDGYQTRLGEELYQSGDVTSWLGGVLRKHFDAIAFGALGYYVPPKHAARVGEICQAVASTGFGSGWVLPGLPVTDSDMLRDGILRGLTDEIDGLMDRLATERAAAKATRESGDIGHKRANTFLVDLRKIGERVVAYAVVLGDERVAAARERVRLAIVDLEVLLADDHQGISARFSMVWDEIERDRRRAGGTL